jgi:hypothetical protein
MKINKTLTALIAGASLGLSGQAFAANGTDSGTLISNTASLKYTVNSVDQDDITDDATFLVATRVDFTLSTPDNTATTVTPGGTDYVLTYDITNEGNAPFDFSLSALNMTTGGTTISSDTDNSDMASIGIFADTNDNGSYDSGTDLAITFLDEVAADDAAPVRFFIVADAPTTLTDKQIAGIDVTAVVKAGGTASSEGSLITATAITDAFNPAIVQVVVANSTDTVTDTYLVGSAILTIAKTVTVINDPLCDHPAGDYRLAGACVNDATYIPKAIPGATVEYTIVLDNDSSATASAENLILTDDLNIDGDDTDTAIDFDIATISTIDVDVTNLVIDNTTSNTVVTGLVTVNFNEIANGEDATITFTVDLL